MLLLFETESVYEAQDGLECLTFLPQPLVPGYSMGHLPIFFSQCCEFIYFFFFFFFFILSREKKNQ